MDELIRRWFFVCVRLTVFSTSLVMCRFKNPYVNRFAIPISGMSWLIMLWLVVMRPMKHLFELKIYSLIASGLIDIMLFVERNGWKFVLTGISVLGLRVIFVRFVKPEAERFYIEHVKKELNPRDQRKIKMGFKFYDAQMYINESSISKKKFFFGTNSFKKAGIFRKPIPFYIDQKKLTQHVQVIGGTGKGKTESILKPISLQNAAMGCPTVFVDGKADINLIYQFPAFLKEKGIGFFLFNTLDIDDPEIGTDVRQSNTFNPLLFSNQPARLTDILTLSLDLESETDANYYYGIQKSFLMCLFDLFLATNHLFTFEDILEFISYEEARVYVYQLAKEQGNKESAQNMQTFLGTLKKNYPELIGLRNTIDQLFVSDKKVSELVNVYDSEIDLKNILDIKQFVLFSLSSGDRYRSNMAIAKMVISIMNSLVGAKQGLRRKPFWMIVLDEFGQYATEALNPLITTARNTNTSVVLSHQSQAQLQGIKGLNDIIKDNTDTKFIFQTQQDADDWAKYMGTIQTYKRTDVLEDDVFGTETREGKASNREVDAFFIDPNVYRNLKTGQSVCKYTPSDQDKGLDSVVLNHGIIDIKIKNFPLFCSMKSRENKGLNLNLIRSNQEEPITLAKNFR